MSEEINLTPEQQKQKDFSERPQDFVDIKTLIVAVQRGKDILEMRTLVNPATRHELMLANAEITRSINNIISYNEMMQAKEAQSKIVKPSGFINRITKGAFGKGK